MRTIYPAAAAAEIALVERGDRSDAASQAIAALAGLYAYPPAPAGPESAEPQPWVRANMVASADGGGALSGLSAGLSGAADRLVFSVLRSLADVILVGAGTARDEKYRPVRPAEVWPQLRAGRPATPAIAVVTRRLSLDAAGPLLSGAPPDARTIVLTTQLCPGARQAAAGASGADVAVAGRDHVTAAAMIGALAARGHRRILVEGGPGLLSQISAGGLLSELCLTVSPLLEGGRAGRILKPPAGPGAGPPWPPAGLTLSHVLEDSGFLLCRYLAGTRAVS